jgi:hypothetical protein
VNHTLQSSHHKNGRVDCRIFSDVETVKVGRNGTVVLGVIRTEKSLAWPFKGIYQLSCSLSKEKYVDLCYKSRVFRIRFQNIVLTPNEIVQVEND